MRRGYDLLEGISKKFILVFICLFAVGFAVIAGISSNVFPDDYIDEYYIVQSDSLLLNIGVLIIGIVICYIAQKLILRGELLQQQKRLDRIVWVLCGLLFIALVVWIHSAHGKFEADQYRVYEGVIQMLHGDYISVNGYAEYFQFYPHQLSLAFLWQLIFGLFHTENEIIIKYINAICCIITIYFGYRIIKELTEEVKAHFCYVILGFTFIPMYLYVHYIYGDVISIALANVAIWSVIKWCKFQKLPYMLVSVLSIVLGVLARKNFSIILVAIVIALLYHIIKNKCLKSLLLLALSVGIVVGSNALITQYYENKAGISDIKGIPTAYWICTGMQESYLGCGAFNNDLLNGFYEIAEMDHDMYDSHMRAMIHGRIRDLVNNPEYTCDFYYNKMALQWNDCLFTSTYLTADTKCQMTDIEWSVYYGNIHENMSRYMNRYVFMLYIGLAVGMVALWNQKIEIYQMISLIAIIGGILFSILWEAKARYVMPYIVLMQPFAAFGMMQLMIVAEKAARKCKKRQ